MNQIANQLLLFKLSLMLYCVLCLLCANVSYVFSCEQLLNVVSALRVNSVHYTESDCIFFYFDYKAA